MIRRGKHKRSAKQSKHSRQVNMQKVVARQKKVLLSLAGIGASGFTDVSVEHDTYLYEKR
jgi:hypothetical protein